MWPYLALVTGSVSGGQAWPIRCGSLLSHVYIACNMRHDLSKVPLHLIVATGPMDLLYVDFTSIEMTLELNRPPKVVNILVFQDHFTKHVMAYVTPNQKAKTVVKFLYQGYILISGALARLLNNWGVNFMSSIIDEMCKLLSMKKLPHLTTQRWMGWWRGLIKPLCGWLGSWEKTKRPTGQDIWLK